MTDRLKDVNEVFVAAIHEGIIRLYKNENGLIEADHAIVIENKIAKIVKKDHIEGHEIDPMPLFEKANKRARWPRPKIEFTQERLEQLRIQKCDENMHHLLATVCAFYLIDKSTLIGITGLAENLYTHVWRKGEAPIAGLDYRTCDSLLNNRRGMSKHD